MERIAANSSVGRAATLLKLEAEPLPRFQQRRQHGNYQKYTGRATATISATHTTWKLPKQIRWIIWSTVFKQTVRFIHEGSFAFQVVARVDFVFDCLCLVLAFRLDFARLMVWIPLGGVEPRCILQVDCRSSRSGLLSLSIPSPAERFLQIACEVARSVGRAKGC